MPVREIGTDQLTRFGEASATAAAEIAAADQNIIEVFSREAAPRRQARRRR